MKLYYDVSVKFYDMKAAVSNIRFALACGRVGECETVLDSIFGKYGYEATQVVSRLGHYGYSPDIIGGGTSPDFSGSEAIRDYGREFQERYNALEYGDD